MSVDGGTGNAFDYEETDVGRATRRPTVLPSPERIQRTAQRPRELLFASDTTNRPDVLCQSCHFLRLPIPNGCEMVAHRYDARQSIPSRYGTRTQWNRLDWDNLKYLDPADGIREVADVYAYTLGGN